MHTVVRLKNGEKCKIAFTHHRSARRNADNVIILHGFGSSREVIDKTLAASLKKLSFKEKVGLNIFTLDLPGHGDSEKELSKFSIDAATEALGSFMDNMQIESAHIYGSSMGGSVGIKFAAKHPERVKTLTIQGAPIHGNPLKKYKAVSKILFSVRHAVRAIRRGKYTPLNHLNEERLLLVMYGVIPPDHLMSPLEKLLAKILNNPKPGTNPATIQRILDMEGMRETIVGSIKKIPAIAAMEYVLDMIGMDLRKELNTLQTPLFAIDGENPEHPFVDTLDKIKSLVPGSKTLVIENEGHLVTILEHEEIAKHFLNFILNTSTH